MNSKVSVLIVDDAGFMVKALTDLLKSDDDIEVLGSARDGRDALEKIRELKPDVVTLDVDMPIMDGIHAVRHIMIESPVPVVMLSSLFEHGDITFEALRLGVVDFLPKPSGAVSRDIEDVRQDIIERVKIAAAQRIENVRRVRLKQWEVSDAIADRYRYQSLDYMIAVGTTLGGPNTVIKLMSNLPPDLPASVVVIQELAVSILPAFVEKFNTYTPWRVELAKDNQIIEQGVCYISSYKEPFTVGLDAANNAVLKQGGKNNANSIDRLFTTIAGIFEDHTIGVLLNGVGEDGHTGLAEIKQKGGHTIAQSVETCVYPNLTECAIERGVVDYILDTDQLSTKIQQLTDTAGNNEK